ncbi:MAG: FmdB family zinc ribbon protein [Spirochaetota bacterium]
MPLYEYQCSSCGRVSEHLVGVGSEQPLLACSCGSSELRRMISLVSVQRGAAPEACCGGGACESGACENPHAGSCACGA